METQTSEIKAVVKIEGAILTHQAINTLEGYQEDNNDMLNYKTEVLSDVVCFIATVVNNDDDFPANIKKQDILSWLNDLSHLRNELKQFAKP